ncbi:hypothetical protein ACI0FM_09995 [Paenochrobactrum sp. BZR 588]|uniref:hypothetical protein n=1 Tax=unclassified Paenochrobactrum TaxID=2639760 RepID=UPI0038555DDF
MFGLKKDRYAADDRLQVQFFSATNGQRIIASAFAPMAAAPYLYHPVASTACEAAPRRFS